MSIRYLLLLKIFFLFSQTAFSETVYKEPKDFLKEVFHKKDNSSDIPEAKTIAFFGKRKKQIAKILTHKPSSIRARYWRKDDTTAFILEEIGKVQPITVGLVTEKSKIKKIEVLIYRESHGSEVRHSFFRKQFLGAGLKNNYKLSKKIDGISGATLSVNALKRLAALALFLENEIITKK